MQKNRIPCIKTADFAHMCGTNKRTLIHYDEIGLFAPAYTNDLGYRFYSEDQCDVFHTIVCLKDIGMPLKDIKEYITHRNPRNLKKLLQEQHKKIKAEIAHLNRIDRVIQTKIGLVEVSNAITPDQVTLEHCDTEYLILSKPVNSNAHDVIIHSLYEHIAFCNSCHLNTGHPYGAMLPIEQVAKGIYDTYAYFFTKVASPPFGQDYFIKPEGSYITTYLKGNYYEADPAFARLLDYALTQGLTPLDYVYKEAILDEIAVLTPDDFLTKISIPIKETCESITQG